MERLFLGRFAPRLRKLLELLHKLIVKVLFLLHTLQLQLFDLRFLNLDLFQAFLILLTAHHPGFKALLLLFKDLIPSISVYFLVFRVFRYPALGLVIE